MVQQRLSLFVILIVISLLGTSCRWSGSEHRPASTLEPTLEPTTRPVPTFGQEPEPQPDERDEPSEPTPEPTPKPVAVAPQPPPTRAVATKTPVSRIVVGSKTLTEQLLLGKMLFLKLKYEGYKVIDQTGVGGTKPVREALEKREIHLYWEYTGTALSNLPHNLPPNVATGPDAALDILRTADEARGLLWLGRLDFNNPYTLIVPPSTVAEKDIETIEELAAFVRADDSLKVCGDVEFMVNPDGLQGLQKHYGFNLKKEDTPIMSLDEVYKGLRDGNCDVGASFSTDGRIRAGEFHELEDTKGYFAFYHPALVIAEELFAEKPELATILPEFLQEIRSRLSHITMSQLNACVDLGVDGEPDSGDEVDAEEVAEAFLQEQELACLPRQIVVGSETHTEPLLLREILLKVLEDKGYNVVPKTLVNRQAVREAIKEGEIDLYWGFTGLALSDDHQIPADQLPTDPDGAFETAHNLDENHHGLLWLAPAAFNKTYALLVQPSRVERGLATLEDLAKRVKNKASLKICVSSDFKNDPAGLQGLQEHYDFDFRDDNILVMPLDESYTGLRKGRCDVAQGLSTDSRIDAWGFHRLEDTKPFFAANVAAPVVREALLDEYPELKESLAQIGVHLDNRQMSRLNAEVEIGADGEPSSGDEEQAQTVAHRFVEEEVMPPPRIVVGSQEPLVQSLLGKMLLLVLEDAGYEVLEREAEDTEAIRDAINEEEIDLYWELTGSALTVHHGLSPNESTLLSGSEKEIFELAKRFDSQQGLVWLEPANFNQTYTLIVSPETAKEGMTTLEKVAGFITQRAEFMHDYAELVDDYEEFMGDREEFTDNYEEFIDDPHGFIDDYEEFIDEDDPFIKDYEEFVDDYEEFIDDYKAFLDDPDEEFKICVSDEFYEREHDGLLAMQEYYGFEFKKQNILEMPQDETYSDLRRRRCQVAQGLSMDTLIDDQEFHELEDSRRFFPFNLPAPVIREAFLDEHPELEELLNEIGPRLDEETMTSLNRRVDIGTDGVPSSGDEESVESVARSFLCQMGLLNHNCPLIADNSAVCEELLSNGGFERHWYWERPLTHRQAQLSDDYSRTGDRALLLGITDKEHQSDDAASHSVAKQKVFIPEDAKSATLSYWYSPFSEDLHGRDTQGALIYNLDQDSIEQKLLGETSNRQSWTLRQHDLSRFAGQEIYLYFYVTNDGNGSPSAMYLDDVSLQACYDE